MFEGLQNAPLSIVPCALCPLNKYYTSVDFLIVKFDNSNEREIPDHFICFAASFHIAFFQFPGMYAADICLF